VAEVGKIGLAHVASFPYMHAAAVVAFWGVALLLILVPGPDWAFTIGAGARHRSALPAVAGLVLGYLGMTVVVAAGVGAIVARSPAALTTLTLAGGAYLVWHGATTLRVPIAASADVADGPAAPRAIVARGIGVSGLNPKGLLVFVALLPQFTQRHGGWPLALQVALLGLVFTATCAAFYLALGTFARSLLVGRDRAAALVTRIAGAGMLVVGTALVLERALG
jgi:threonine/homoserine/homoserine lactone efflux protein